MKTLAGQNTRGLTPVVLVGHKQVRNCPRHGEYEANVLRLTFKTKKPIYSQCPECKRELEKKRKAMEEKEKQIFIQNLQDQSGIPPRFLQSSFDNFRPNTPGEAKMNSQILAYAKNFTECQKQGTSLVLCGVPGTGKTHLACDAVIL